MFCENLKKIRKSKGLSQEQLACELNVVRQTISKWEKGYSMPDAELLVRLADVLEVSVSDLLGSKIEITEDKNEIESLSKEIAKLNDLITLYGKKISKLKKAIGIFIAIAVIFFFLAAIYVPWSDMWYEFGKNLYHLFN